MTKLQRHIIKTISQITKNIKLNKNLVQINAYVEVKMIDIVSNTKKTKLTEEDIMCIKLANKS